MLALVPPGSDTEQIVSTAGGATCVPFEQSQRVAEAALTEARHNLLIALNSLQLTIEGECR